MVDDTLKYKRLEGVAEALQALADGAITESVGLETLTELAGKLPVSVIWGAKDAVIAAPEPQAYKDAGIELHLLPNVGHMAMVEAADEVNRLIRARFG